MNVGILGHVDSGKTSLARALSTIGSTAAFDKHATSANLRANTIDLGFSSFTVDGTQIALIDCPGHGSLIRAALAAATVFDMAIVVVDASKGIEAQTAEHLLLVSLLCSQHVIIVLNKIDLVEKKQLAVVSRRVGKALKQLGISEGPIVEVSLLTPSQAEVDKVIAAVRSSLYVPTRVSTGKFVMCVDHCFPVKGKGTVMTGTVIDGGCRIGMEVDIPLLKEKRRIKGMQRWKEDVVSANVGERVALLFQNLPFDDIDRTVLFEPGALLPTQSILVSANFITHFKGNLPDKAKVHISTGFSTVMAICAFLRKESDDEYEVVPELCETVEYALLSLEQSIYTKEGSFYMASKLDNQGKGCRFAFHGRVTRVLTSDAADISIFRRKKRSGRVERVESETSLICSSLFKKETDLKTFAGMCVRLSSGERGNIEGAFGKSGKVRISIRGGLLPSTVNSIDNGQSVSVDLHMKKYLNNKSLVAYVPEL